MTAEEFVRGYHHALYLAAGITLCGAIVAAVTVRKARHAEAQPAARGKSGSVGYRWRADRQPRKAWDAPGAAEHRGVAP